MPKSREFAAISTSEYRPFAGALRDWVIDWQAGKNRLGGKRIALPTQGYLARLIGTDPASFSRWMEGSMLPRSEAVPMIGYVFVHPLEEVLTIINIDLSQRDKAAYETYGSLIDYLQANRQIADRDRYLRLLEVTQGGEWNADQHPPNDPTSWHAYTERSLTQSDIPADYKLLALARGIEAWLAEQHPGRHRPQAKALGPVANGYEETVTAIA